jgi:hypothetical protein
VAFLISTEHAPVHRCAQVGRASWRVLSRGEIADIAKVMRWYRELLPALQEELAGWIGLITIPPAPPFPEALWGRKSCAMVSSALDTLALIELAEGPPGCRPLALPGGDRGRRADR